MFGVGVWTCMCLDNIFLPVVEPMRISPKELLLIDHQNIFRYKIFHFLFAKSQYVTVCCHDHFK